MSRHDALTHKISGQQGPDWVFQQPTSNGRPLFSGFRPEWYHPKIPVELPTSPPRVSFHSEVSNRFTEVLVEPIVQTLPNSGKATADPRPREYVERSFAERKARFHEIIESLRQAFDDDDMVTAYSEWVTLRWLLSELRFAAKKERGERWHMFGALHDAVAFTSIERLRLPMVETLARAFALACDENTRAIDVHRLLRDGCLDLTPQSSR